MIVVDTNIIAYFFIPGAMTDLARSVALRDSNWVVPSFWRSEFRNVLALYLRRREFDLQRAIYLMREAEELLTQSERSVDSVEVLRLVSKSGCSAYDCEFVALARKLGIPLITNDKAILAEFPMVAIGPDKFLESS